MFLPRETAIEVLFDRADQRLDFQRAILGDRFFDARDLRFEERRGLDEVVDARAAEALHQDADAAVGQLQHAHDDGDGADAVEILFARILVLKVLLRGQHDHAVLGQRLVDGVDRLLPRYRQRNDDEREDDQILQRQNRKDVGNFDCFFFRGFIRVSHVRPLSRAGEEPGCSCAMAVPAGSCSFQSVQLFDERFDVFETAVNRGESHVRHRIELAQPVHDHRPELLARDLPFPRVVHAALDGIGEPLQRSLRHRPFAAGDVEASHEFLAVIRFTPFVALDHHERLDVDLLVAGEAPLATNTFAPPADDFPFPALSRIDHPILGVPAERAAHDAPYITR